MSSVQYLNPRAEVLRKVQALAMNINASRSLQSIMKTNLGPKGTLKMLVGGAGQIKITKDGSVLLHEMQIQHPTAAMIARSATAQDDIVGDGTTSNVLLIGELLYQAEKLIQEGLHPRVITEGYELSRQYCLKFLDSFKQERDIDSTLLRNVAKTSLCSKVHPDIANLLVDAVVESVLLIRKDEQPIDLFMVEIMHMQNKLGTETRFIRGLVLDHGTRHPDMPKRLENVYILNANVSLEYEKTEVNSGFYFTTADQREKLAESERKFTDERCRKIVQLKRKVCEGTNKGFILINQKGIDPICLDMLAKENIMALRRAKRRNGERIALAFGGKCVNSVDDITEEDLGFAEQVYEQSLGDDKYTFVEGAKNPKSCTILIRGPNEHTIAIIKDAVRDGLRAVKNTIEDKSVIPGAGAFEIAAYVALQEFKDSVKGKAKLGVDAFAESLLIVPKILAENAGFDVQDTIIELIDEYKKNKVPTGLNIDDGKALSPEMAGIFDNYCVKRSTLNIAPVLAEQLLLVDEVIKAGKRMGGGDQNEGQ